MADKVKCTRCNEPYSPSMFLEQKRTIIRNEVIISYKRRPWCKFCTSDYNRDYRAKQRLKKETKLKTE